MASAPSSTRAPRVTSSSSSRVSGASVMVTVDMRPPGLGTPLLEAVLARDAADRIQGVSRPEGQAPNSQERAHLVDLLQTSSFGVGNRGLTVRSARMVHTCSEK